MSKIVFKDGDDPYKKIRQSGLKNIRPKVKTLVPETGVEPARPYGHMTLNHARLPIPPFGHFANAKIGFSGIK